MIIKIITVGKLKEEFLKSGVKHYIKHILRKARLEIFELPDEKTPDSISEKQMESIKNIEGERILSKVKPSDYVVALAIDGKRLDTEEFGSFMKRIGEEGKTITFIIGGSLGLSEDVLTRSDYKMSFSEMTFPHQLMRVILLEQINKAL